MNREQKRILRETIAAVRTHRRAVPWWELKRQIFDGGCQSWYPAQGDFLAAAERAVGRLPAETRDELIAEWRQSRRSDEGAETILAGYPALIVEEIVARAWVAAYRTSNW